MIGLSEPDTWLQTDWILIQFGPSRSAAIEAYIDFVRAGVGLPSLWEKLQGDIYLGSDAFISHMQALAKSDTFSEIPRMQRRRPGRSLTEYEGSTNDRSMAMVAAHASGDYTLAQIAQHFGVHYATVSRAIARHRKINQS